jgi:hypothetical protein
MLHIIKEKTLGRNSPHGLTLVGRKEEEEEKEDEEEEKEDEKEEEDEEEECTSGCQ